MRWLQIHPLLQKSKYLCAFLKEDMANGFKEVQNEMEKETLVSEIEDMWSPEGVQRVVLNEIYDNHMVCLETLCTASLAISKKQKAHLKQVIIASDQLSSSLYQLGEGYKSLNEVAMKYNTDNPAGAAPKLSDMAVSLNNATVQWGN